MNKRYLTSFGAILLLTAILPRLTTYAQLNGLTADFTGAPVAGDIPLNVQFTDESTGDIEGRAWYFGDERFDGEWDKMIDEAGWLPKGNHACVVLPNGHIVITAGTPPIGFTNDVWRSTDYGASWEPMTLKADWPVRYEHDSVVLQDGAILVIGGNSFGTNLDDVWRSEDEGATWTKVTDDAPWDKRFNHRCVVMPDGSIILSGGQIAQVQNDVWRSTDGGETWNEVTGDAPWGARRAHEMVALPDGGIVIMGGLVGAGGLTNDVWRSEDMGETWEMLTDTAPWSKRRDFLAVTLPDGTIVLMGGASVEDYQSVDNNDVWLSRDRGETWEQARAAAEWNGRERMAGGVLPDGSIILTAGWSSAGGLEQTNDVWRLETAGSIQQNPEHVYTEPGSYTVALQVRGAAAFDNTQKVDYITVTIPSLTADFSADVTTGSAPLTVNFVDESEGAPTGWAWYFGEEELSGAWTEMTAFAEWTARERLSSVVLPDGSIVMTGGHNGSGGGTRDVWRSEDMGANWTEQTASAEWSPRFGHTSVVSSNGNIVLLGGHATDPHGITNDVWLSTDKGATWSQQTAKADWLARRAHSTVILPDGSIVLMGGYTNTPAFLGANDVWRSQDEGATWELMTDNAEWAPRAKHISVALPDGSIVLMGGDANKRTNDVWRSTDMGTTWTLMTEQAEWSSMRHTGVVLPDGSIVLMGGEDDGDQLWRSTDMGATWTLENPSVEWRKFFHASVVLPDGSIVTMGGQNESFLRQRDVWRLETAGSYLQNPSYTYNDLGQYRVSMQAHNVWRFDSVTKDDYINVVPPAPEMRVLGTDGSLIQSGAAAKAGNGTHFGELTWGSTRTRTFSITNSGTATLNITGATIAGSGASAFEVTDLPDSVIIGGKRTFKVTFGPDQGGSHPAALELANDSDVTPYLVNLAGTGRKKGQTIDFPAIPDQRMTNIVDLTATASSGLPVSFAVTDGPGVITSGTRLGFTGAGQVSVRASQAGDQRWNAAPDVVNVFRVTSGWRPTDFGGEGVSDISVYLPHTGYWYAWSPASGLVAWEAQWGGAGFTPVPDDYTGDGMSDLAVYHEATGWWFGRTLAGELLFWEEQWGGAGFTPVPGDYSGDGRADLAVYHEATGYWYAWSLSENRLLFWEEQWGGAGFTPVPGDYTGDGISDLAVYADGVWFVKGLDGNIVFWDQNWGGAGYDPLGR